LKQFFIILVCLTICGCETTNQSGNSSVSATSSTPFIHSNTKFSFPSSVGTFHRVSIEKYDRDGKDVGVGYNSSTPIVATVFVYPGAKDFALLPSPKIEGVSASLIEHHFEACKRDVFRAHPDASLASEGWTSLVQGENHYAGKNAVFSISYRFGFGSKDSVSELYVFLIEPGVKFLLTERYFVTYRITYPSSQKIQAEAEVADFMANLAWPAK
jgi:hypothetical protein